MILRLVAASLIVLVASGCKTANAPTAIPGSKASYTVVDATGPFWSFWDRAHDLPSQEQLRLFKELVVGAHPELFVREVVGIDPSKDHDDLDERLGAYLASLPARIEVMRNLTRSIHEDLATYDASFRAAFPDMAWSGTIYFTVSVDAFDGAMRKVNGKPALLFGIDKIAKVHGASANLSALFHHELFHTYHDSVNPFDTEDRGMLRPLWMEGLAVYVSKQLDPTATWSQLELNDEMVHDTSAKLPAVAKELRLQLDLTTEETYRDFFLGAGKRTDLPKRCAYYVGYRVADRVGQGKSLPALARLKGPELHAAVDGALASFEAEGR